MLCYICVMCSLLDLNITYLICVLCMYDALLPSLTFAVRHADALPGRHDQAAGMADNGKHVSVQAAPVQAHLGCGRGMGDDQGLQAGAQRRGGWNRQIPGSRNAWEYAIENQVDGGFTGPNESGGWNRQISGSRNA